MIILDSSTLILLAKTDLLQLLTVKTLVTIPVEVRDEVLAKPTLYDAKLISRLLHSRHIQVSKQTDAPQREQLQKDFNLGKGEAAALLLAKISKIPLGIDDGPGIKAAKIMGVPFFTAIRVLIELFKKGKISFKMANFKLKKLENAGRYNIQILEDARSQISGEE